jgi:competence protein ComEC
MRCLIRLATAVAAALFTHCAAAQQNVPALPSAVTIEVLDVGQGDSILIRSPEGKTALIDAGPSNHVVTLLAQRGIVALDLAVITHHHADHYGGMLAVIERFHPRVLLTSGSPHTSEHYLKILQAVRDQGIRSIEPSDVPRKISLGSAALTVFPQAPDDPREENNNSVGLRLQFGAFSALLPGDAQDSERSWWEKSVPDLCADATVLKLAHHGSRNGTDAVWLARVRPRLAIASSGRDNEFGHPHPETLSLLARAHIPLLRTDQAGTVTVRSDGERWQVSSHPQVPTVSLAPTPSRTRRSSGERAEATRVVHTKPKEPVQSVDINRAAEGELRTLPGIGPMLARRIIAGRPYHDVSEVGEIEGIGKKRLAEIRPYIRVE